MTLRRRRVLAASFASLLSLAFLPYVLFGQTTRDRSDTDGTPPIVRLSSFEDLRSKSNDERARAEVHDFPGRPLRELPDVSTLGGGITEPPLPTLRLDGAPPPPPPTTHSELQKVVCAADAVAIGSATSRRLLLNKSETGIFTDYAFSVAQPIRSISIGQIVVSRFGGMAYIGGNVYTTPEFRPIQLGAAYLLLLQRIPKTTDSYRTTLLPIVIRDGTIDFALLTTQPVSDPRGPEPANKVAQELAHIARDCPRK